MRNTLCLFVGLTALGSSASAQPQTYSYPYSTQQPIYPYSDVAAPPAATTTPAPPSNVAPPAYPPPYPYSYPYPYGYYRPYGFAPYPYPYAPPVVRIKRPLPPRRPAPLERVRLFSIGLRATGLGINQQIGGQDTILYGGGLELRFRNRGHFGIETALDFLHGDFTLNGPISRDSMPFTISLMGYIFPNDDIHHFNIYFLGGGGIVSTTMTLIDERNLQVKQDFTEWELHVGLGAELRYSWFALRADARGVALWRYDNDIPAAWYTNVDGGPVPSSSYGLQITAGAAAWF